MLGKIGQAGRDAKQKRLNDAWNANHQAIKFQQHGERSKAVAAFEEAVRLSPDDPIIRQNLANAQGELRNQQQEEETERQAKASAARMHQSIQSLAQSFNVAPSANVAPATGGLDFTATIATPPPSGDPKVVDARNVPSGLPKAVDNAIAGAYANAPPGVSDRVRKGFQAVMNRDWKVAKAWFQDALNRDPDNVGLKRLVALAGTTHEPNRQVAPLAAVPEGKLQLPDPDDVQFLFPGQQRPASSPDDVYYYVPSKGYNRMTLEEAHLHQALDTMMGVPAGSIVTIDSSGLFQR